MVAAWIEMAFAGFDAEMRAETRVRLRDLLRRLRESGNASTLNPPPSAGAREVGEEEFYTIMKADPVYPGWRTCHIHYLEDTLLRGVASMKAELGSISEAALSDEEKEALDSIRQELFDLLSRLEVRPEEGSGDSPHP